MTAAKPKRSKSNLIQVQEQHKARVMDAEERRHFLQILGLWRCFDFWYEGLQEVEA